MKIFVLAGTGDGRELAAVLKDAGHEVLVSTLSEYGAELASEQGLVVRSGALEAGTFQKLLTDGGFEAVVDATHPYAGQVKKMVEEVCGKLSLPYLAWQRPSLELAAHPLLHLAENIPEAAALAASLGKRIMLTTGSNRLEEWIASPSLRDKSLFVRVLPTATVLARCEGLGLKPKQIIAAQGPFTQAWNEAMFKQLEINVVITKESGQTGGAWEKVRACLGLHIPLVILKRPHAPGGSQIRTISEFMLKLEEMR